ncbi:MAG: helix-turn-helix domain-containing protein [Clostridia bacterium]|nr:helix-turn-helix domain-containing protein [Clostridia bacterium]
MENRIRQLRKKYHMSQIHLSIELEVSQETVSAYESGKHFPSFQSLVKLSEIFGCSIDYIMGLSDESSLSRRLSDDESRLLTSFSGLNEKSRAMALSYIQALTDMQNNK